MGWGVDEKGPRARALKEKLHGVPEGAPETWRIRIHRAISWLDRAEREADDPDAGFIFLWIAFNAAYARVLGIEEPSRKQLGAFLASLAGLDHGHRLREAIFKEFSGPIRTLIGNKFVFEPFWRALREHDASEGWKLQFEAGQRASMRAVINGDTAIVLGVVFDRLYVLRNQLVHGGATWNSGVNRAQVRDGAAIMASLVPIILDLMLEHPEADGGEIFYPVV